MTTVYDHEAALTYFWFNTGGTAKCIRHDGEVKIVHRYIDALNFFNGEDEPEILQDSENDF